MFLCWLSVHPSVIHPSVFLFPEDNLSECQWIFTKLSKCALILWRSGLGLLMGKFHQFLTKNLARDGSIFSFPDDNFSKYQWIFTKLDVCIDIEEICFGMLIGKICPFLTESSARDMSVFSFLDDNY